MNPAQAAAYIQAQAVAAYAEICAMQVNDIGVTAGVRPGPHHSPEEYRSIQARFTIGCNDVMGIFAEANRT